MTTPGQVMRDLEILGGELGGPRWAQGPGGNVSVKHEGLLFVKASGMRLSDVAREGGHVAVPLDDARGALAGDANAEARTFARTPRPSLETYFHALEGRVVAHTHSIAAMLVACASKPLVPSLVRVPYQRPGRDLALAIRAARGDADAVLLESHGLIVFANDASSAVARSNAIADACARALDVELHAYDAWLEASIAFGNAEPIANGFVRRVPPRDMSDRYAFPDAVVFASYVWTDVLDEATIERELARRNRAFVLAAGAERFAVAKTEAALQSTVEVLAAHDFVVDTLGPRTKWLPMDEPAKILGLPAEQYRMTRA